VAAPPRIVDGRHLRLVGKLRTQPPRDLKREPPHPQLPSTSDASSGKPRGGAIFLVDACTTTPNPRLPWLGSGAGQRDERSPDSPSTVPGQSVPRSRAASPRPDPGDLLSLDQRQLARGTLPWPPRRDPQPLYLRADRPDLATCLTGDPTHRSNRVEPLRSRGPLGFKQPQHHNLSSTQTHE